ncbi:MAG: aldose 1-epimerase family protein [Ruminococcaceae bacterium]|nr:aldose 1-epimerase family protein [Oscillospiraceae bacterium]
MTELKNQFVTARISERGAELKSLTCGGVEYIWEGDSKFWGSSCPIVFPICSGLKEGKYTFEGREYSLQKHGYARFKTFELEECDGQHAVFLHKSDDDTRAQFPFDYEFRTVFTLEGKTLRIDYSVKNTGAGKMYFNLGGHEGYATSEGIEEYDVIFSDSISLYASQLEENLLSDKTVTVMEDTSVLPLKEEYFAVDALIFRDIGSRSLTLRNRNSGRSLRIDYPDAEHLLLWQVMGAPFICIEPWNGLPDVVGSGYDITQKVGIKVLEAGEEFVFSHTLTVV